MNENDEMQQLLNQAAVAHFNELYGHLTPWTNKDSKEFHDFF
jgi:hypothetical protein